MQTLARCAPAMGLALLLVLVSSAGAANPPISINSKYESGEVVVRYQGRNVLVYSIARNKFKPYVRELYTLRGENVLRDAPPDHLHHHGLMYATYVNGINFWEESGTPGFEEHAQLHGHKAWIDAKGVPMSDFTEVIEWVILTNSVTRGAIRAGLLYEERTLTIAIDEQNQEVALRWDSRFQVGPYASKLTIHGPNYNGLGLRLPESFNHVAKFQNSAGLPYTGPNTQNVIPARWTSVSGFMDGHEVMLVMFGRPDNARGDGFFFTMLEPFAYLSATQGLDKKPLEYSAGDKFSLSYLLTVYSTNKSPEFIRQRSKLWQKERK